MTLHFVSEYDPPAEGFESRFKINLTEELIPHPNSTYLVRLESSELEGSGVFSGDIMTVDRALNPNNNDLVLAYLNGERVVRFYEKTKNTITLHASRHSDSTSYIIQPTDVFELFGVVSTIIRKIK